MSTDVLPDTSELDLIASICREDFAFFVKEFWLTVPAAEPLVWNWHLEVLCQEMQQIAEGVIAGCPREHDLLINIPPGTSKSTICSILFPAWVWTRMPNARFITASHTELLALDLATKSRIVIKSELYSMLFGEMTLSIDQNTKGYFTNIFGGSRLTCTVAGKSPVGLHGHFLLCLPWESLITTDQGLLPIGKVVDEKLPVRVLGFDHQSKQAAWQSIEAYEMNPGRPLCRIKCHNGGVLELTEDHPIYVVGKGYVEACNVRSGDEVIYETMSGVWEGAQSGGSGMGSLGCVLRQGMQKQGSEWSKSPSIYARASHSSLLREVWKEGQAGADVLQLRMQRLDAAGGEALQDTMQITNEMSLVRQGVQSLREGAKYRPGEVLFPGVRGQDAFDQNERQEQSQLHSRGRLCSVFGGVCCVAEDHPQARALQVSPLRQDGTRQWGRAKRSSHRLEQVQQCQRESSGFVSSVPSRIARKRSETRSWGTTIVESVEVGVRVPEATYNIQVGPHHNYFAEGILVHNCDDPLDPKEAVSQASLKTAQDFYDNVIPSRKVNKETAVTVTIMQRLHEEDPSGHLLKKAKKHGAATLRHICLPAELPRNGDGAYLPANVSPQELAKRYVNGLLDPKRLPQKVLDERKTDGMYSYAGQYLQNPTPLTGGQFKEVWFLKRAKAAPREVARRVRYFDRASTSAHVNADACRTAGVLMARDYEGRYWVEHVELGQWEPHERNEHILACAMRDRARYGPKHDPVIWIEREGGASGRDAWLWIARKLAGFKVKEHNVQGLGNKITRAEPWACQLAAGNCYLVDDGTWDLNEFIAEHKAFPRGKWKDQVDSASGAFACLAGKLERAAPRVYALSQKRGILRLVVCTREELASLVIERHDCLLVRVWDPDEIAVIPEVGFKAVDSLDLDFANVDPKDYQDTWLERIPAYGQRCEKVMMTREHGKQFWSFLTRKRGSSPDVWVIVSQQGNRALSLAMGVCDAMNLKRGESVYQVGNPDNKNEGDAPNKHIWEVVTSTKGMVI